MRTGVALCVINQAIFSLFIESILNLKGFPTLNVLLRKTWAGEFDKPAGLLSAVDLWMICWPSSRSLQREDLEIKNKPACFDWKQLFIFLCFLKLNA